MSRRTVEERFWSKIDKSAGPDECWPWKAGTVKGYGWFWANGKDNQAHRFVYELVVGAIPDGLDILHKCDNPPCCNPSHLWPGTDLDNVRDCESKGRAVHPRGERNGTHTHPERIPCGERHGSHTHPESRPRGERHVSAKLTEAQVGEIRRLFAEGHFQREIGRLMGVTQAHISKIVLDKAWRHIPPCRLFTERVKEVT